MKAVYTLKPLVLVRLLAEATVLLILIFLPVCTVFVPRLQHLPLIPHLAIYTLAVIAAGVAPFYGLIAWRVKLDDRGVTAVSAFRRQFVAWEKIERLSFRVTLSWRRYVVGYEGGELTFPIWLAGLKELVQTIRDRLPAGARMGGASGPRLFRRDLFGVASQFFQVAIGVLFIAVFWYFFATIAGAQSASRTDCSLVLAGCILVTVLVGWRSLVIAFMPRSLEVAGDGLVVRTCFFTRRFTWSQVKGLRPSFFVLPEGLMLKTAGGSFLLTDELEAVDELEQAIRDRLQPPEDEPRMSGKAK